MVRKNIKKAVNNYPDLVSDNFKAVYKKIGFDNLMIFLEEYEGIALYIPSAKGVFKDCIIEQVKKDFKGDNLKKLSRDYQMTERTIRNYIFYY